MYMPLCTRMRRPEQDIRFLTLFFTTVGSRFFLTMKQEHTILPFCPLSYLEIYLTLSPRAGVSDMYGLAKIFYVGTGYLNSGPNVCRKSTQNI